mmetsp:Transcript_13505/g.26573  ORF Transcript_13505/g.26573 Transcript_13505/m.26573 type:complete len:249 (+) Transcript_13505:1022-1768(+)
MEQRPMSTPFPAKSTHKCAIPRPLAAFDAMTTQARYFSRKAAASNSTREHQRTIFACCSLSSAKDMASSRAVASCCADLPACLAPALDPRSAPAARRGHTAALSFQEARNIAKVPPRIEHENRTIFCSFGTISAQRVTSPSNAIAMELASLPEPAAGALGSALRRAANTSVAIEARSFSAVVSKMNVRIDPATAPTPNKARLPRSGPEPVPGASSHAFFNCAPVRKFTKDVTTKAPAPRNSLGNSGRK